MYTLKIKDQIVELELDEFDDSKFHLNGSPYQINYFYHNDLFHIIFNNKTYVVKLISSNKDSNNYYVSINNKIFNIEISDAKNKYSKIIGLKLSDDNKKLDVTSPMPGLVIDVLVNVNETVEKNQSLIILEAMKMENVIKSPVQAKIKSIMVKKGDNVNKNEVLISFFE